MRTMDEALQDIAHHGWACLGTFDRDEAKSLENLRQGVMNALADGVTKGEKKAVVYWLDAGDSSLHAELWGCVDPVVRPLGRLSELVAYLNRRGLETVRLEVNAYLFMVRIQLQMSVADFPNLPADVHDRLTGILA